MRSALRKHIRRFSGASTVGIALAAALVAFAMPATAAVTRTAAAPAPPAHGARSPHIMYINMENTDYSQTAGASSMPYWNELAHQYAVFTQAFGWTYPSLPNYMEFLTGSTNGISSDCDPGDAGCTNLTPNTLTDEMEKAGISWHAYFQDDPTGCDNSPNDFFTGNYDVEHNAFAYMADFEQQCSHLSNFDSLISNLNSPNAADFNWVIPDLDNDGGDNGTMYSGDTWMNAAVPQILNSTWYKQGGQVIISYDTGYQDSQGLPTQENNPNIPNGPGGLIPAIVISAHTKGMGVVSLPHNTAGLLRSVEQAYGLPLLGDSADPANGSLGDALVSGRPEGFPPPSPTFNGAIFHLARSNGRLHVTNLRGSSESFNGIYRFPNGRTIERWREQPRTRSRGHLDTGSDCGSRHCEPDVDLLRQRLDLLRRRHGDPQQRRRRGSDCGKRDSDEGHPGAGHVCLLRRLLPEHEHVLRGGLRHQRRRRCCRNHHQRRAGTADRSP